MSASWDHLLATSALPRLDARALLAHASGRSREWLLAHGDEPADPDIAQRFRDLAARRRAGAPLAYLIGWREFHGRRFSVTPAVLVPRPETEELIGPALQQLPPPDGPAPRVLDLGTGSGVIAITLALLRPDAVVVATDASPAALDVARDNARTLGANDIEWVLGDWWTALPPGTPPFDLVVSNPPYIAEADAHLLDPALRHEPRGALASGADGLDAIGAIVAGAPTRLVPGGWLLLEHGHDQGPAVRARLGQAGFESVGTLPDLEGRDRFTLGRRAIADRTGRHSRTV